MSLFHKFRPQWQQTMFRIANPQRTIDYYQKNFGFTLLDQIDFPSMKFSLYFMATLPHGETYTLKPGSAEAHEYLWNFKGVTIELTHNHGSDDFKANNGNVEPHRGFGHIAVLTNDVYEATEKLLSNGVNFQKKPDEGRMKGLAFALDPDGYWVEIVKRADGHSLKTEYNLAQTMLRVKDGEKSVAFYQKYFGMTLLRAAPYPEAKFTNYFMGQLTDDEKSRFSTIPDDDVDQKKTFINSLHNPILELTYNHGTELEEGNVYHDGNSDPKGFGHIGYLVDDAELFCEELEKDGVPFQKKMKDGSIKCIAFVKDPTGYWIEIIPRGVKLPQELMQ